MNMRHVFKRNQFETERKIQRVDSSRRNFIKFVLFGAGVLVAERLLGSLAFFRGETVLDAAALGKFRVTETGAHYSVSDSGGHEILIIEKNN